MVGGGEIPTQGGIILSGNRRETFAGSQWRSQKVLELLADIDDEIDRRVIGLGLTCKQNWRAVGSLLVRDSDIRRIEIKVRKFTKTECATLSQT